MDVRVETTDISDLRVRGPVSDHTSTHDTLDRGSTHTRFGIPDTLYPDTAQFHPSSSKRFILALVLRTPVFKTSAPQPHFHPHHS